MQKKLQRKTRRRILRKKLRKRIMKTSSLFLMIVTSFCATILEYAWNERPKIYFKIEPPSRFYPNDEPLHFPVLMCNTGGIDASVNVLVKVESFFRSSSTWFCEEYHAFFVKFSLILVRGEKNFTAIPICIQLEHRPSVFNMSIIVKLHLSFDTIFGEILSLSPTQFTYKLQETGEYLLSSSF